MKKLFSTFASFSSLAALLIAFSACSSPPPPAPPPLPAPRTVTLTAENNGQTIRLVRGDTLKISLEGNPTTGYSWTLLSANNSALQQVGTYDFKPSTSALGSPGFFTYTFQAVAAGSGRVEMVYVRPFEKDAPPREAYSLNILVQ